MVGTTAPGINITERSIGASLASPNANSTIGMVGFFEWGPTNSPISIDSSAKLVSTFGKPSGVTYEDFLVAESILKYSNRLYIQRSPKANAVYSNSGTAGAVFQGKYAGALVNGYTISAALYNKKDMLFNESTLVNVAYTKTGTKLSISDDEFKANIEVGTVLLYTKDDTTYIMKVKVITGNDYTVEVLVNTDLTSDMFGTYSKTLPTTDVAGGTLKFYNWEYASEFSFIAPEKEKGVHLIVLDSEGKVVEKFKNLSLNMGEIDDLGNNVSMLSMLSKEEPTTGRMDENRSKFISLIGKSIASSDFKLANKSVIKEAFPKTGTSNAGFVGDTPATADYIKSGSMGFDNLVESGSNVIVVGEDSASADLSKTMVDHAIRSGEVVVSISPSVAADAATVAETITYLDKIPTSSYWFASNSVKKVYDSHSRNYRWIPTSGDLAGLLVSAEFTYGVGASPAGGKKGILLNCEELLYTPTKIEQDKLFTAYVNPLIKDPTYGYILNGDVTRIKRSAPNEYITIRKMSNDIKNQLSKLSKVYLFERNDAETRLRFKSSVERYLETWVGLGSIIEYEVDTSATTDLDIDSGTFRCKVAFKPTTSIRYIEIELSSVGKSINFDEV